MELTDDEKKRLKVERVYDNYLDDSLSGSIEDAIKFLKSKQALAKKEGLEIFITMRDRDWSDCCNQERLCLCYLEEETDEEYKKRIKRVIEQKEIRDRYERQNYERLKKLYG